MAGVPYQLDPTGYAHDGAKLNANFAAVADAAGLSEAATVAVLTDDSGGTSGGNTIAAITDTGNAGSADFAPTKNAIATLAAKINAILSALEAAGLMAS